MAKQSKTQDLKSQKALNAELNTQRKILRSQDKDSKAYKRTLEGILKLVEKEQTVRKKIGVENKRVEKQTKSLGTQLQRNLSTQVDLNNAGKQAIIGAESFKLKRKAISKLIDTDLDQNMDLSSLLIGQLGTANDINDAQLKIGTTLFDTSKIESEHGEHQKKIDQDRLDLMTNRHDLSADEQKVAKETLDIAQSELNVQKDIVKFQNKTNDATQDLQGKMEGVKDQAMDFGAQLVSIAKNPALALGAGLLLAGKYLYDMFKGAMALKSELGISDEAAAGLQMQITDTAAAFKMAGVEAGDVKDAALGLMDNFGGVNAVTPELLSGMAKMKAELGVSGTNAANLMVAMKATGAASEEAAFEMAKTVGHLAQAEGVAPGQVMQDLAQNTEAFASFAKDGGLNVAKAAIQAKKLGINFDTSVKIADNLLNFESSIQSQMEAEILLGRQLNLDKARSMALSGDMEGLQKEILKNVGTEAEFNAMNVLQRRALAQSIGVSVTELSKMVANQSNLNKQTKSQAATAKGMAYVMKVIRDLGGDLLGVWQAIKPILMIALLPIGIAVFALVKLLSFLATGINYINQFGNAASIVLGILTAWYMWTLLQGAIEAKNLVGRIAMTAWTWAGVVAAKAMAAAQWLINVAMGANPIGAIILGVIALVALIGYLVVKFGLVKYILGAIGVAMALAFWPITLAIGAVYLLYKGFMWVADAVGGIGQLMKYIGMALLVALGPIGWLIGAGLLIWKNFDKIKETIMGIGKTIIDFVMSPIRKLKAFFSGLLPGWAVKLLGGGEDASKSAATNTGPEAQDFISRPGSGMEKFSEGDTVIGVKDEDSLGGGGTSIDIAPITEGLGGVIDSIRALEASNKVLTNSLIGKVKGLAEGGV